MKINAILTAAAALTPVSALAHHGDHAQMGLLESISHAIVSHAAQGALALGLGVGASLLALRVTRKARG